MSIIHLSLSSLLSLSFSLVSLLCSVAVLFVRKPMLKSSSSSSPASDTPVAPLRHEQTQYKIFTGASPESYLSPPSSASSGTGSVLPPPPPSSSVPPPPSSSSSSSSSSSFTPSLLLRLFACVSLSLHESSCLPPNANVPLTPLDCSVRRSLEVKNCPDGVSSPNCSFTSFAPLAFEKVRRLYGVTDLELRSSLDASNPVSEIKVGTGKSGAFFLVTSDCRFVVKTLTKEEKETLLKILARYVAHLAANRGTTLLPFFLGCYRIRVGGCKVRIVVMQNMLPRIMSAETTTLTVYDLKGSTHNRSAGKDAAVKKDLDWSEEKRKITLQSSCRERTVRGMKEDLKFLADVDIMDYSLLLAVHKTTLLERCLAPLSRLRLATTSSSHHLAARPLASAPPSPPSEQYYVGIIDILQEYSTKKTVETVFKTITMGPQITLSSVEPMTYRCRFENFMNSHVFG